jgi:hypothetical protein
LCVIFCAAGVELSPVGTKISRDNFSFPPIEIIKEITGVEDEDYINKRIGSVSFSVREGSITEIPFPDNSFEAVFSNSVIEQIPREYMRAFSESFRVSKKIGVWSEPFVEAQGWNIFYRLYLRNIDYFSASYKNVLKCGWRFLSFTVPNMQKSLFNTGFLVCEKWMLQRK